MLSTAILQELVTKLNNWLHQLHQQKIISDHLDDENKEHYGFHIVRDEQKSEKLILRKLTRFGNRLKYAFSNIRDIKVVVNAHQGLSFLILSELTANAFINFNNRFEALSKSLLQRAIEGTPRPTRLNKSLSLPNYQYSLPQKNIQDVLRSQNFQICLNYIEFDIVSEYDLEQLKIKLMYGKNESLSLVGCNLGKLPSSIFLLVMDIIQIAKPKKIILKKNALDLLNKENLEHLFQTLTKTKIVDVDFSKNNIGHLLSQQKALFKKYLEQNILKRLSLSQNEINDDITAILGQYGHINTLLLDSNMLSDKGVLPFFHNDNIRHLNLFNTQVSINTKEQLDLRCKINRKRDEQDFVEKVIVIAQGYKKTNNIFHQLPKDVMLFILMLAGLELRRIDSVRYLCTLVLNNFLESSSSKFVWNKELETSHGERKLVFVTTTPLPLFFKRTQENISENDISSQQLSHSKLIK